jgi:hypothetical protein
MFKSAQKSPYEYDSYPTKLRLILKSDHGQETSQKRNRRNEGQLHLAQNGGCSIPALGIHQSTNLKTTKQWTISNRNRFKKRSHLPWASANQWGWNWQHRTGHHWTCLRQESVYSFSVYVSDAEALFQVQLTVHFPLTFPQPERLTGKTMCVHDLSATMCAHACDCFGLRHPLNIYRLLNGMPGPYQRNLLAIPSHLAHRIELAPILRILGHYSCPTNTPDSLLPKKHPEWVMIQLVKFGILDLETVSEGWREA